MGIPMKPCIPAPADWEGRSSVCKASFDTGNSRAKLLFTYFEDGVYIGRELVEFSSITFADRLTGHLACSVSAMT